MDKKRHKPSEINGQQATSLSFSVTHSQSQREVAMPRAAIALNSPSLCFSSSPSSSTPSPSSNNISSSNCCLTTRPKTTHHLVQKHHPLYTTTQRNISHQFKEKVLCLEIMGVDSGRALSLNPSLHSTSLEDINLIISFLQSKGILQKDMGRLFGMCPKILTSDIKSDLNPVFSFISRELDVPDQNFRKVINKCPRLLTCSVRDQLKPALFYLQRLGFRNLEALAYHDPILLVSSVENTLIPKLNYLVGLGFSRNDVIGMVLRCPGLFTFSVENNFIPKFDYFKNEMKGELDWLKDFPQYFAFSLEKRIKPRHIEVLQSGILNLPLSQMLKTTDQEFHELLKAK